MTTDVTITPAEGFPVESSLEGPDGISTVTTTYPHSEIVIMNPDLTLTITEPPDKPADVRTSVLIETGPDGEDAAVVEYINPEGTITMRWIVQPDTVESPAMMTGQSMRITLAQGDTP